MTECENCSRQAKYKEIGQLGNHYYCSKDCQIDYHTKMNKKGLVWACDLDLKEINKKEW